MRVNTDSFGELLPAMFCRHGVLAGRQLREQERPITTRLQYTLALSTADEAWRQRTAEFGRRDWTALRMARRVGDYLGGIGDWPGARRHLDLSLREARAMHTPNELATLELMRSLAVAPTPEGRKR